MQMFLISAPATEVVEGSGLSSVMIILSFAFFIWSIVWMCNVRSELRKSNNKLDTVIESLSRITTHLEDEATPDIVKKQNSTIKVINNGKYTVLPSHVDCPECGASVNATPCPNCGYHIENNEDK